MSISKLGSIENVNRDTPLSTEKNNLTFNETPAPIVRDNKQLMDAAKMYEHHFLQEMVKAMRSTVSESSLTSGGIGDKVYKDQLDNQYVEKWSESGGIGLADMIYDEMMDKFINRYQNRGAKPPGPIPLTDRDVSRVLKAPTQLKNQTAMRVELKDDPLKTGPTQLKAPFDSKVLTTTRVDGKSTILLEHEGGVRSAIIFDGVLTQVKPGDSLKSGTQIGVLSPEVKSFFWNVSQPSELKLTQTKDNSVSVNFSGPEPASSKEEKLR